MSQQHRKWIELVKERIEKRGWSQTDLAIVVGVSPSAITQLFKDGKGSDDLKLRINKKLRINESWEKFEEEENERNHTQCHSIINNFNTDDDYSNKDDKKWLADFFDKQDEWLKKHFENLVKRLFL